MATCTFFRHKDTPQQANPILRATLIDLIENKNVNMFYVGNHGNFDNMVRSNLKSLKLDYPNINYAVVLAYMPHKRMNYIARTIPTLFVRTVLKTRCRNTP